MVILSLVYLFKGTDRDEFLLDDFRLRLPHLARVEAILYLPAESADVKGPLGVLVAMAFCDLFDVVEGSVKDGHVNILREVAGRDPPH